MGWERIQSMNKPVVSAHLVESHQTQLCISKQKIKICSGQSEVTSEGMTRSKPLSLKTKLVEYVCVSKGTSTAESLKKRAKSGESLSLELSQMPTAFSKMEAEPIACGAAKSSGIGGGSTGVGGSGMGGENAGYESMPGIGGGNGGYGSPSGMGGGMNGNNGGWGSGMSGRRASSRMGRMRGGFEMGGSYGGSRTGGSGIEGGYGRSGSMSGR